MSAEIAEQSLVVLVTAPSEEKAAAMARVVVEEKLAACVNLIAPIRSIYRWEGAVCDEAEVLMVIKTRDGLFERLRSRIVALHDYSCPEVVALRVERGHEPYLRWIGASTSGD